MPRLTRKELPLRRLPVEVLEQQAARTRGSVMQDTTDAEYMRLASASNISAHVSDLQRMVDLAFGGAVYHAIATQARAVFRGVHPQIEKHEKNGTPYEDVKDLYDTRSRAISAYCCPVNEINDAIITASIKLALDNGFTPSLVNIPSRLWHHVVNPLAYSTQPRSRFTATRSAVFDMESFFLKTTKTASAQPSGAAILDFFPRPIGGVIFETPYGHLAMAEGKEIAGAMVSSTPCSIYASPTSLGAPAFHSTNFSSGQFPLKHRDIYVVESVSVSGPAPENIKINFKLVTLNPVIKDQFGKIIPLSVRFPHQMWFADSTASGPGGLHGTTQRPKPKETSRNDY